MKGRRGGRGIGDGLESCMCLEGPVPIVHFEGIAVFSFTGAKFFGDAVFNS